MTEHEQIMQEFKHLRAEAEASREAFSILLAYMKNLAEDNKKLLQEINASRTIGYSLYDKIKDVDKMLIGIEAKASSIQSSVKYLNREASPTYQ